MLITGTPAPHFAARTSEIPRLQLHLAAGRVLVLCFLGSAADPASAGLLREVLPRRDLFDGRAVFCGVSTDPQDEQQQRLRDGPGIRSVWDFDRSITRLYEAEGAPRSVVLDERLRIAAVLPFGPEPREHVARVEEVVRALLAAAREQQALAHAPVLVVPRVFEQGLCNALVEMHARGGGFDGGVMRQAGAETVTIVDHDHKRRRDAVIDDERLRTDCFVRLRDRLLPEIGKAFQFRTTHVERYLVGCYDAATGDHFKPHRDNTTDATRHRRFAVSLLLNGDFEGGELRFPEFGPYLHRVPAGAALVFSCSLLHEVLPVTRGKRYAFLPFLHDDGAEQLRRPAAAGPAG